STVACRGLLCLPALVYLLIAAYWRVRNVDYLTGDETYYLIISESLIDEGDVDVANNMQRRGWQAGWHESQTIGRPHGWFSVHNVGLSALVAVPWGLGGTFGARLAMVACCGLAAPTVYRTINRVWRQPRGSLLLALALALSMPLLDASSQIYPDLPAGVLLLFAATCAAEGAERGPFEGWRALLFTAAVSMLPWLHIKYAAAALIAVAWRLDTTRRSAAWRLSTLWPPVAAIGSLASLAAYNVYAFGKMSGPYSEGSGLALHLNAFIVFMGLHFDQAQGMFFEQPLWLLGVIGLAPMWRSARRECLWWLILYATAILPNALHPNWYGGYSFVGRFGSTAVLLWSLPLAHGVKMLFGENLRLPAVLAAASLVLQAGLAALWLPANHGLFNQGGRECLWAYNSLFPALLKNYLPYWLPYSQFWRYSANFGALLFASGALACGWLWPRHPALAKRCFAGAALAAVAVVVLWPARATSVAWSAENLSRDIGRDEGELRVATEGRDARGMLAKSPELFASRGRYQVDVDYQAHGAADYVGAVMLKDGQNLKLLSLLTPGRGELQHNESTTIVSRSDGDEPLAVFVWYEGRGSLSVARLSVEKLSR
ncbi:MAG TPA: hypothetical protein VFI31_17710, partial [Pirellulales bacterium]|nr:hypothetical protein [Pirellulales bacterium]